MRKNQSQKYSSWPATAGAAVLCVPVLAVQAFGAEAPSASVPTTPPPVSAPAGGSAAVATDAKAGAAASSGFEKPAWLSDLALGVKESWDDNIFGVSGDNRARKSSWITTASPKLGVNFAPLFDKDSGIQALSLAYTPDYAIYHGSLEESYYAHRFGTVAKVKTGAVSLSVDNGFTYVDGSTTAPTYWGNDSGRSASATALPRERRKQIQDRSRIALQYDQEKWFVRPTASLLYYDLMTEQRANPTGGTYQNYADRNDVNGGWDLGYKVQPQLALTLGYRYGHQFQETFSKTLDSHQLSSSGDYQRVLAGAEGKPLEWLTVAVQAGPDFRDFDASAPVDDKHLMTYYGEASATAQVSSNDSFSFKYKQWQWVSSTGKLPLFESTYDLTYSRKVTDALSLQLGGKVSESDYTMGDVHRAGATTSIYRDDAVFSLSPSVTYAFSRNLSATLAYTVDLGRNMEDGVLQKTGVDSKYRNFDHDLISLGVLYKF